MIPPYPLKRNTIVDQFFDKDTPRRTHLAVRDNPAESFLPLVQVLSIR